MLSKASFPLDVHHVVSINGQVHYISTTEATKSCIIIFDIAVIFESPEVFFAPGSCRCFNLCISNSKPGLQQKTEI